MNPLQDLFLAAGAVTASAVAAAMLAAAPVHHPAAQAVGPPRATLECEMNVEPGHGTLLRLTHRGGLPLERGTRVAWATLGTPAAQGEVSALPEALAQDDSVSLESRLLAHGSSCVAVVLE